MNETVPTQALPEPETTEQPKRGRRLGSKNKEKIDYDQRIEDLISAMNDLIEKGELTPTVERAYNRQIEYFQFQIQRRDDAKKGRDRRELESKVSDNPVSPVPAVPVPTPDAKSVDSESKQRLTNLLKKLGAQHERTPEPEKAEVEPKPSAEQVKKAAEAAERKAAEDSEKKAADDKRIARIAELKEARDEILKGRHGRDFMIAAVSSPTFLRDGNLALKNIAAELQRLEPAPVGNSTGADIEEIKAENRRVQREYEKDYMFERSGGQTIRPNNYGQFRDEDE